ncbi:uncharacterized protein KQ657_000968 [Scheffersomyces spartinae]|uniref:Uncharacterized protein n=1 Tax=Scheffersomyces spartinae TaxID=45513 RepID=A0A9P7V8A2_9ASCO|nr:uncharacterized protein KQ657_000968 [Scheffersomyces spartinae]KAG7193207.1 hypothetical protein KQ657_000968 [Scheffersomyces spartinae]
MDRAITNPENYNKRDLLLLCQLLHNNHLIQPDDVVENNNDKVTEIIDEWYNHKAIKISQEMHQLPFQHKPALKQITKLYANSLNVFGASTTTELANILYYDRIQEIEDTLQQMKKNFIQTLDG